FNKLKIDLDKTPVEHLSNYIAIEYFLTIEDEPPSDVTNLEKVNRYLQSFDHLCEVKDWEKANKILLTNLNNTNGESNENLANLLHVWDYHSELVKIYSKLCDNLNKLNKHTEATCWQNLARGYRFLDQYSDAEVFYKKAQSLFDDLGEKKKIGWIFHDLGLMDADRNKDQDAYENYKKALNIFKKNHDFKGIALVLNDIARVKVNQRKYSKAIQIYRQIIDSYLPKVKDEESRAWIFHNFSRSLTNRGEYREAYKYNAQSLKLFRQIDHRTGIGWSLYNFSLLALCLKKNKSAYVFANNGLTLFRELKNQTGIASLLHVLGVIAFSQDRSKTFDFYKEKILIWHHLGNLPGIAQALEGFARLSLEREPLCAIRLFSAAQAIRRNTKFALPFSDIDEYKLSVNTARKNLDATTFKSAWTSGMQMSPKEAIREALSIKSK
ncbi:MAG: hypothetical protein RLZZ69_2876, partial [Cyanobacteriota bacterium]